MQQQLAAYSLKEFKKKKSAEYPGAQSESESGKEDVNGVDMQILKGKHFFFFFKKADITQHIHTFITCLFC